MKVERERRDNKSRERVKKQKEKEADKIHVECNYRGSMKIRVRI